MDQREKQVSSWPEIYTQHSAEANALYTRLFQYADKFGISKQQIAATCELFKGVQKVLSGTKLPILQQENGRLKKDNKDLYTAISANISHEETVAA